MTAAPSQFGRVGLGWVFTPGTWNITFTVDQIKWKDGDLHALVEVRSTRSDTPQFLARDKCNLTSVRSKTDFTRKLTARAGGSIREDEWLGMVESMAIRIGDAEQQGDPVQWVGLEEPPSGSPYVVARLAEQHGINVLFGPGNEGKSWIGRYLTICIQLGIPVLGYLAVRQMETLWVDYETDKDTDARRVRAILRGLDKPYQDLRRWEPKDMLLRQVGPLSRILAAETVGFYGIDSAGHAAGSPGEHGGWEDSGLNLGRACKALAPATGFLLDHTTAEGSREKLSGRASGAYRKFADARVMWECRKDQEAENSWLIAGLYHTKWNNSVKWSPIGIRLDFESDVWGRATSVRFSQADLRESGGHLERLGTFERAQALLEEEGDLNTKQLASKLKESYDTVKKAMQRGEQKGLVIGLNRDSSGGRGVVQTWRNRHVENRDNISPLSKPPSVPVIGAATRANTETNQDTNTGTVPVSRWANGAMEWEEEDTTDVPF